MSDTNRCTGHCCRAFFLALTPDDVRVFLRAQNGTAFIEDGATILPMVIPLGLQAGDPDPIRPGAVLTTADAERRYTCRHFDPRTDDCRIYARRPTMCREYPIGTCRIPGCTLKGAAAA